MAALTLSLAKAVAERFPAGNKTLEGVFCARLGRRGLSRVRGARKKGKPALATHAALSLPALWQRKEEAWRLLAAPLTGYAVSPCLAAVKARFTPTSPVTDSTITLAEDVKSHYLP